MARFKQDAADIPEPLLFETLEPRVLMSADLSFAQGGAGIHDLTLHFDQSGQTFQLLNPANNNAVVQSVASPTDGKLNISANAGANSLTVDFASLQGLPALNLNFIRAQSQDTGTIRVAQDGDIALSDTQAKSGTATVSINGFNNANLLGGDGASTFTLTGWTHSFSVDGGGGRDVLRAPDTTNNWVLTGPNQGTLNGNSFSGIEVLGGGSGDDTYHFNADNNLGSVEIDDSNGGVNSLDFSPTVSSSVTVDISDTAMQTVNGNLKLGLSSGESITNLTGGGGNDKLTGNNFDNVIDGGAGNDILTGGVGDDVYVFTGNWGSDTVKEKAGTNSGHGNDTLDFSTISANLTAKLNIDTDGNFSVGDGLNSVIA